MQFFNSQNNSIQLLKKNGKLKFFKKRKSSKFSTVIQTYQRRLFYNVYCRLLKQRKNNNFK